MKIVGLITEYNPFHNGHLYHIQKAKELTGADYCIVVMSGDFVQRGIPAFLPKHLRTKMALSAGADLVLELPSCYACGSAEYFAQGAIALLNNLGCVDNLCFGSECGNYEALDRIADVLSHEPEVYKDILQANLKNGLSFPAARKNALKSFFNNSYMEQILDEPNNILGIEYIKALKISGSKIKGCTIQRQASSYHDKDLIETYSSASAIRNLFSTNNELPDFDKLKDQMPADSLSILKTYYGQKYPVFSNDLSLLLKYKLLSETKSSLTAYQDVTPELANRIYNNRNKFQSFDQFCDLLKTKDITYSRISRSLLHIVLNIYASDLQLYKTYDDCFYARVLGFRKSSSDLFGILKNTATVPVLTKITQTESLSSAGMHMLNQDIFCSDLYESIVADKFKKDFVNEYYKQIVKY